jgi:hypothetical protein
MIFHLPNFKELKTLYNPLRRCFPSMQPREFIISDATQFEDLGFHVIGVSMYFGLKTITAPGCTLTASNATAEQQKRLVLALWLKAQGAKEGVPKVLLAVKDPTAETSDFYPFLNGSQDIFCADVTEALSKSLQRLQPVYIRCGTETCCDYMFLYWKVEGRKTKCIAVLCDAPEHGSADSVTCGNQTQLFGAVVKVSKAFLNADLPEVTQVYPSFVTKMTYLATDQKTSDASKNQARKLLGACAAAQKLFPSLALQMLNKDTFDFGPFTDALFARKSAEGKLK